MITKVSQLSKGGHLWTVLYPFIIAADCTVEPLDFVGLGTSTGGDENLPAQSQGYY